MNYCITAFARRLVLSVALTLSFCGAAAAQHGFPSLGADTLANVFRRNIEVNTLSFNLVFIPPPEMEIKYIPTRSVMSVGRTKPTDYKQLNVGVKTLAELEHDYVLANPSQVNLTWDMIPELWRPLSDNRPEGREKAQNAELAKYFETDGYYRNNMKMHKLPEKPKSPWTITGEENVQLSQLFLSNWVKGGESSTTLLSDLRFKASYKKDKHQWENDIIHKLGVTHTSVLGTRLSDDVVDLSSKYGYEAIKNWFYSFKNTFKTQLFRNYSKNDKEKERPKSAFFSPAYIQFIFGMDYKKKDLSLLLSPYTSIITIVADTSLVDKSQYSITGDKKRMSVNGFSVSVNWKKKLAVNITYTTKGELFYEYFKKGGQKRFDWENIFDMQINRYLTTRLLSELRFFDNESKKFQFKENFSIAFKYSF